MLTPVFDLSQNDEYVVITIKAPYAKISETEIFIEEFDFRFHSNPYFLRLTLPGQVIEDGREQAKYDTDTGSFTVRVPKVNRGEHFDGLDMLTKLLAPSGSRSAKAPTIEVLEECEGAESSSLPMAGENSGDEEEFDWQIEQSLPVEEPLVSTDSPTYGFANKRSGVFKRLQEELHEIIDLPDADNTPAHIRKQLKSDYEEDVFDDEHYMADFCDEDGIIQNLLEYKSEWAEEYEQMMQGGDIDKIVELTEDEKKVMRNLTRKEFMLNSITRQQVYLGLVDILFAYAYNRRVTEGEHNVESGWTICKLSGTLSWLQTHGCIKDVLIASFKSSLCHPLYRHWGLAEMVQQDVYKLLKLGRRKILKCFLEIRDILGKSDNRYILNDLYINDYCIWIQSASKKKFDSLAESLNEVSISKAEVGFELDILEQACKLAVEESSDVNHESNVDANLQESTKAAVESTTEDSSESEYTDTDTTETESEDDDTDEVSENESHNVESVPTVCSQLDNLTLSSEGMNPRSAEEANIVQRRSNDTTESTRDNLIEDIGTSSKDSADIQGGSIDSQASSQESRQDDSLKDYSMDTGLEKQLNDCKIAQITEHDCLSPDENVQQTDSNVNEASKQLNPRDSSSLNF